MKVWGIWATLAFAILAFVLGQAMGFAVLSMVKTIDPGRVDTDGISVAIYTLISNPVEVVTLVLAIQLLGTNALEYLGLDMPHPRDVAIALAALAATIAVADAMTFALGKDMVPAFQIELHRTAREEGSLPWLWLAIIVAAPVGRGAVVPRLHVPRLRPRAARRAARHPHHLPDLVDAARAVRLVRHLPGVRDRRAVRLRALAHRLDDDRDPDARPAQPRKRGRDGDRDGVGVGAGEQKAVHMPDSLMAGLWAGLLATSPLEALAVLSGLVYVVLAVPRSRWCWVAGGFSSLIYVWLFARARLPMQSLLQAWYVGVAVYGFLRWSREVTTGRLATVVARPCRRYCRVAAAGYGHRAFPGGGDAGGLAPS